MKFDLKKIEMSGGRIYGDDDFVIIKCNNCGYLYLHNEEVLLTYPEASNLNLNFLLIDPNPCIGCGGSPWEFESIDFGSQMALQSEWAAFIENS